jgi:hypothetical protein
MYNLAALQHIVNFHIFSAPYAKKHGKKWEAKFFTVCVYSLDSFNGWFCHCGSLGGSKSICQLHIDTVRTSSLLPRLHPVVLTMLCWSSSWPVPSSCGELPRPSLLRSWHGVTPLRPSTTHQANDGRRTRAWWRQWRWGSEQWWWWHVGEDGLHFWPDKWARTHPPPR